MKRFYIPEGELVVTGENITISPKIVITSDETMMSQYRGGIFLGFSACMPQGLIPDWLYFHAILPPVRRRNGQAVFADPGLRMVEASLLNDGFSEGEVAVVHPNDLHRMVGPDTKIVAIGGHDILGMNPPTSTFVDMARTGQPYNRIKFLELVRHPSLEDVTIVVGGKSAWQVSDPEIMKKLGIDHVFLGECEVTLPRVFRQILNHEEVPSVIIGEEPGIDRIPNLRHPTIHGVVECSRGCGRGCDFCTPAMQKVRYKPVDQIITDVKMNLDAGNKDLCLHSEDMLRYGAKGIVANEEKVMELFTRVASLDGVRAIGMSHIALATAYHHPGLIEALSDTLNTLPGQAFTGAQTGIETGSPALMERHMKGKTAPAKPAEWPGIVTESIAMLHDNNWALACTLINGLPGETEDDVLKTIELVESLKGMKIIIIPMNFVSMDHSRLSREQSFTVEKMTPAHWSLAGLCLEQDLKVLRELKDLYRDGNFLVRKVWSVVLDYLINNADSYIDLLKEGNPPKTYEGQAKYLVPEI